MQHQMKAPIMPGSWKIDLVEKQATKIGIDGTKIISAEWHDHRFGDGFSLSTFTGWGRSDFERDGLLNEAIEQIRTAKVLRVQSSLHD